MKVRIILCQDQEEAPAEAEAAEDLEASAEAAAASAEAEEDSEAADAALAARIITDRTTADGSSDRDITAAEVALADLWA